MPDPLVKVEDVAKRLGVNPIYVYKLVESGDIRYTRLGRRLKFRPEDVEDYISRNTFAAVQK